MPAPSRLWAAFMVASSCFTATEAITADSGCICATARANTNSTSTLIPLGCRVFADGARMCLADQGAGLATPCGNYLDVAVNATFTAVGMMDTCTQAAISSFSVSQVPQRLEWNQGPYDFYSGQNITVTWASTKVDENVNMYYVNQNGNRGLSGLGNPITVVASSLNSYTAVAAGSGSTNGYGTNLPVWITSSTSGSTINRTAAERISVIASTLTLNSITVVETGTAFGGSNNNVILNSTLAISWRATGSTQIGNTNVILRRCTSGNCAFGNPTYVVVNTYTLPGAGNRTYNLDLDGVAVNNNYRVQVAASMPSGMGTITQDSAFFAIVTPVPTSTATASATASRSAAATQTASGTATSSMTATSTNTGTSTATATSSATATATSTASASWSPSAPVDLEALARKAAAVNSNGDAGTLIGAVVGTVVVMLLGFVAYQFYQRRKLTAERMRKLRENAKAVVSQNAAHDLYLGAGHRAGPASTRGRNEFAPVAGATAPNLVMYQNSAGPKSAPGTTKAPMGRSTSNSNRGKR